MSRRRIVALALAGALLASGCQDEPEPRFEDPTETPTPSASESSDPPEKQSAEEFIREWFQLSTEMQNSGRTQDFLAVSRRCAACRSLARRVESIYDAGGFVDAGRTQVIRIRHMAKSATIRQFAVDVSEGTTRLREAKGSNTQRLQGGRNEYRMTIVRQDSGWQMKYLLDTPS